MVDEVKGGWTLEELRARRNEILALAEQYGKDAVPL
jgi:hypothetical protein